MLSHTNLKAQQPFAMLTEHFDSSPAKTEDRYLDLSIEEYICLRQTHVPIAVSTTAYEDAEQMIGSRSSFCAIPLH
jgi:hypothetical protein